jgi:hypothetical protein
VGQKIGAGAVLAIIGVTLIILGVGYLGLALATALTPSLGAAGAYAVTGGIFVGPPFFWALIALLVTRKPAPKPIMRQAESSLWMALFAAIAKETPWIAIIGTGLVAAAELFLLGRKKS